MQCEVSAAEYDAAHLHRMGATLADSTRPISERFRSLFELRTCVCPLSVRLIGAAFRTDSALLRHELAYCLGQMRHRDALPLLRAVLSDAAEDTMVRHEAGEALAAIGDPESLDVLQQFSTCPDRVIAETCQLAVAKLNWLSDGAESEKLSQNPYNSTDPAPALNEHSSVDTLRRVFLDDGCSLWDRYRAMFELRNRQCDECVTILSQGLQCGSDLFRHEVAYVLGQLSSPLAVSALTQCLADRKQNYMVRHECAEALGAIDSAVSRRVLREYLGDPCRVVRESCEVALDMVNCV